jgi:hypothetical protein
LDKDDEDVAVLEHPTANSEVATVLGSIPASSDTVESDGRYEAVLNNVHAYKNPKKSPVNLDKDDKES